MASPGFWERPDRFFYPPVGTPQQATTRTQVARPLVIVGQGRLGEATARLCRERGLEHRCVSSSVLLAENSLRDVLTAHRPWAVVNTTGYGQVDEAERASGQFWQTHSAGAALLAQLCTEQGLQLLTFSSDQVFSGEGDTPYQEHDPAAPINAYGRTKLEMERQIRTIFPGALIVRSSGVFGSGTGQGLLGKALSKLRTGEPILVDGHHRFSPTYLPDLIHTSLDLLIDGENGIWHLVNRGESTWAEMVHALGAALRLPQSAVHVASGSDLGWVAPRPRYTALKSCQGQLLPSLDHALDRYLSSRNADLA